MHLSPLNSLAKHCIMICKRKEKKHKKINNPNEKKLLYIKYFFPFCQVALCSLYDYWRRSDTSVVSIGYTIYTIEDKVSGWARDTTVSWGSIQLLFDLFMLLFYIKWITWKCCQHVLERFFSLKKNSKTENICLVYFCLEDTICSSYCRLLL